jgi:hypothetical protein
VNCRHRTPRQDGDERKRRQAIIISLEPLRAADADEPLLVQHVNMFDAKDRIALSLTTARGTVNLTFTSAMADTVSDGLARLAQAVAETSAT